MGLLDQLWDDTVAGPLPDSGLGKLRKYASFSPSSSSASAAAAAAAEGAGGVPAVTRSITMLRPAALSVTSPRSESSSAPSSPASGTPDSPFGTGDSSFFFYPCSLFLVFHLAQI
uniref:Auxin-repressed protein n=1 Tax=Arundo donax TaxID=35708 RepID=A0A0A9HKH2_ARUDO